MRPWGNRLPCLYLVGARAFFWRAGRYLVASNWGLCAHRMAMAPDEWSRFCENLDRFKLCVRHIVLIIGYPYSHCPMLPRILGSAEDPYLYQYRLHGVRNLGPKRCARRHTWANFIRIRLQIGRPILMCAIWGSILRKVFLGITNRPTRAASRSFRPRAWVNSSMARRPLSRAAQRLRIRAWGAIVAPRPIGLPLAVLVMRRNYLAV